MGGIYTAYDIRKAIVIHKVYISALPYSAWHILGLLSLSWISKLFTNIHIYLRKHLQSSSQNTMHTPSPYRFCPYFGTSRKPCSVICRSEFKKIHKRQVKPATYTYICNKQLLGYLLQQKAGRRTTMAMTIWNETCCILIASVQCNRVFILSLYYCPGQYVFSHYEKLHFWACKVQMSQTFRVFK